MKLRIKGNSIRLRLTQTELDQLQTDGRVEETTAFGPGRRLVYALAAAEGLDALIATFDAGELVVSLPADWIDEWAASDRVGFEGTQPLSDGEALDLLVEKDFECLHKRPDEEDAFPHPLAEEA